MSCKSQSTKEFIIKGNLASINNHTIELSIKRDWSFFPYRTVKLKDENFQIRGKIYNPTFGTLKLLKNGEIIDAIDLFIEEGLTSINGTNLLSSATIKGHEEQMLFYEFTSNTSFIANKRSMLLSSLHNETDPSNRATLTEQLQSINNEIKLQTESFIRQHPGSYVSLYLVDNFDMVALDASKEMLSLFHSLRSSVRKSRVGKAIEGTINKRQKFFIGMSMYDFILPDSESNSVQLSKINKRAILLDFGASWCGPCKYEYPFLKSIYESYHGQGFEIVTVSLDKDRKAWLESVSKEELPWIQLSNLQGFQTEAALLYEVDAIPSNFLLDSSGKIQSVDRHGEDLLKIVITLLNQ